MALISVIMPVWNGARTLGGTLDSLAAQCPDGIETIAVDQGSDDGSREMLARFARRFPVTIIDAPDSRSWMTNTNIGLRAAKGEIATILHQDDLWFAGRAAKLRALHARYPQADLLIHAAALIDLSDRRVGTMAPPFGSRERLVDSDEALRTLIVQNTIALPGAAFRLAAALEIGGLSEQLWYTADWDLWLRLAARGPVAWSPERYAAFRIHANSQTVRGSADLTDFESQLAAPVEAHIGRLPRSEADRARRFAVASNKLNVYLAGRYHGHAVSVWPFLRAFLGLGPLGWWTFSRNTQILGRLIPRLKLLLR